MGLTTWTVDGWTAYLGAPWATDSSGCDWHVTAETGWRGSPGARLERVNRARRDGEFDAYRTWLPGRAVQLSGVMTAATHEQVAAGMDRFAAVLADGFLRPLVVDEDGTVRLVQVRRSDAADITWSSARSARWSLLLFAPDPRKYASDTGGGGAITTSTTLPAAATGLTVPADVPWIIDVGGTSGRLVLDNNGTAPSEPEFTIAGPVVNPRIEHATSGRILDFRLELGGTDTLSVVPATGQVLLNGSANARGALTSASAPVSALTFGVGQNEVYYRALSSTGGSMLTATFRPAYY